MFYYSTSPDYVWNGTEFDLTILPEVEGVVYKLWVDPDPDWGFTKTGRPRGAKLFIYSEQDMDYQFGRGYTRPGFEWMNGNFSRTLEGSDADEAIRVWYNY